MNLSFIEPHLNLTGVLVVAVPLSKQLDGFLNQVDAVTQGAISRAVHVKGFEAKLGQTLAITAPYGTTLSKILIMGIGEKEKTQQTATEFGGKISALLGTCQDDVVSVYIPAESCKKIGHPEAMAYVADGFNLRSWRFNKYRTKQEAAEKCAVTSAFFMSSDRARSETVYAPLKQIAEGVFLTRHTTSEPPNVLYPETMAEYARQLESAGLKVTVLDEHDMSKLGMNALLGVGQGSTRESRLVVLEWAGGAAGDAPVAFVGKGVTFDTGGISIKPSADMDDMKWDMGGSGVVLGLMKALAGRKARVNAVGVLGLVENMPDGNAQRPGDIVTSLSGQTIEILNTDAEGRLVLADALWYTQDKFKPKSIIDLATLTGAIIISLGHEHAGLFSNNDDLVGQLLTAGKKTGEKLWHLPLSDAYDKDINSPVADVKNLGSGRGAGSITAAQFLQRFVNKTPWAHLDIAGTAWDKKGTPLSEKGATAFGVRLLNQWVKDNCEGEL